MEPLTFTAFVTLFLLVYFVFIGINKYHLIKDQSDFFLADRTLTKNQFSGTFAASSTSLATTLIFFLTFGAIYGLPILIAPITYYIGAIFLAKYSHLFKVGGVIDNRTGLYDFLKFSFKNETTAFLICMVTVLGVISILLIELYVGLRIFSIFATSDSTLIDSAKSASGQPLITQHFILAFISIIIILYTVVGGFPAVVATDKLQLQLMLAGSIVLLGYIVSASLGLVTTNNELHEIKWFPRAIISKDFFFLPIAITTNIIIVNLFLQFTQLRTWQMVAASKNEKIVKLGMIKGASVTVFLWTVFTLIGITSGAVLGLETSSIQAFLISMENYESFFVSNIILPLFFVSCLSAMISTVDTALLPLGQFFTEKIGIKPNILYKSKLIIIGLMFLANVLYYFVFTFLDYSFFQFLFTIFGIVIATGPAILMCLFFAPIAKTVSGRIIAIVSVYSGVTLNLYISYAAPIEDVPYGAPASFILAAIIVATYVFTSMLRNKRRVRHG